MSIKGFIKSDQMEMFGGASVIGFGNHDFRVVEIDRDTANAIIVQNHYSRKVNWAYRIHLGIWTGNLLVGVLQFGYAMNPASCVSVVEGTDMDQYLELNRMWLDDCAPKYAETQALSYAFKYIKKRFPKIKWVQSFADERCGKFGIVYQAANFEYYGEHTSTFWELDGVVYHNSLMTRDPSSRKLAEYLQANKHRAEALTLRQFRYIYWLDRSWKRKCLLKQAAFPKHYADAAVSA